MIKQFYLTKDGLEKVKTEYEALKELQRNEFEEAPSMLEGDALNPDYSFYKENLEGLTRRLEELDNVLKNHVLIKKPAKDSQDKICIGASIIFKNGSAKEEKFRIVGTLEANPFEGKISDESPIGRAFLGKQVGEKVSLGGPNNYKILKIQYEEF
jgi:transcription elongation factor GreA